MKYTAIGETERKKWVFCENLRFFSREKPDGEKNIKLGKARKQRA